MDFGVSGRLFGYVRRGFGLSFFCLLGKSLPDCPMDFLWRYNCPADFGCSGVVFGFVYPCGFTDKWLVRTKNWFTYGG